MFIDADHLKYINDTFGHDMGNLAISSIASVIRQHCPANSVSMRYGGDEFVFGYEGDISKEELDRKVKKVYDILNKGYKRGDLLKNMSVPCSIGIVTAIGGSFDYAKLLKEADNAMYDAKINGKNTYVIREL